MKLSLLHLDSNAFVPAALGLAVLFAATGCGSEFSASDADAAAADSAAPDTGERDTGSGADVTSGPPDASADSGMCPTGESWCAPCGGQGHCAQACPQIACIIDAGAPDSGPAADGGHRDGGERNDGAAPADAAGADASGCAAGETRCSGCGSPYCAKICPAIACVIDAGVRSDDASNDLCGGCGGGNICCAGGTVGSYVCVAPLTSGLCPALP